MFYIFNFAFALHLASNRLSVSMTGALAVLVTIQILAALAVANLVGRKDNPPEFLVWPLEGMLGRVLCLSDMPLVGTVSSACSQVNDDL